MRGVCGVRVVVWTGVLLGGVACAGPVEPRPIAALTVTGGATGTDTVRAQLAVPISLLVADDRGAGRGGVVVRFTTPLPVGSVAFGPEVARTAATAFANLVEVTTDSLGEARAWIRLGSRAGVAVDTVIVSVPEAGLADTLTYSVLAGRTDSLELGPRDTVLYLSATFQFRIRIADRFGNPASDVPFYRRISGASTTVTSAGAAQAVTYGLSRLVAQAGSAADSAEVTVVPQGTLAARTPAGLLVTLELDGSNRVVIDSAASVPAWSPAGDRLVYGREGRLWAIPATGGTPVRLIPNPPAEISEETFPRYGPDGTVYFTGGWSGTWGPWRVTEGGVPERLIPPDLTYSFWYWQGAPSPDGTRLAVVWDPGGEPTVYVVTLADTTFSNWVEPGALPMWSPDGAQIAFYRPELTGEGALWVVAADGTGAHQVSPAGRLYIGDTPAWSPDGRWLIARGLAGLELIDLTSSLVIPLPWAAGWFNPAWRWGS